MANRIKSHVDVLAAIDSLTQNKGYPPSVRELTAELGYKNPASTYVFLVELQEHGLITQQKGLPRTTRLTRKGLHLLKRSK